MGRDVLSARPHRPPLRRLASAARWAVVAALCLLAASSLALRVAGWQPRVVLSGSMEPAISRDDLILVTSQAVRDVRPGQIITFARPHHPGQTITHRVVAIRRAPAGRFAVTTRGDANPAPERWSIPADGTVGRLRARVAGVGALAAPLRGEISRGLAVVATTALLAALALWAIWRPAARKQTQRPTRRPTA
ncbi:signal peptidase I [Conexibacter woesei]|uniref:Signal peptidase I n=1 Tax=Conexibacter woesei (strain DSM 14684 / CCUG 47730 / CIP 108061 / JCM 11494 / NBRC 100937 / ID131577) TaxID=469383 RepID=D3F189_CONWI|nr:signal peptidase I [Conexibacter woesei]ADB52052.1 peptidase S26B, signal peptidase [Conexibacter woesei DSM 14684]